MAKYGDADLLEQRDFALPTGTQLEPKEVLVKILATTATYTDQLIIHGNYRPNPPLPCTPGYDCVGVVENIGSAVTTCKIGDRIASMPQQGCMATHIILPERLVIKIRDDLSPEIAVAYVLTGVTAYQMLHRATGGRLTHDAKILVHGCGGGTGAMLVELAKLAGLPTSNIFGTCSQKSFPVAESLGIRAFDYKTGGWAEEVKCATQGVGVDIVYDPIVLSGYFKQSLACLKPKGKYVAYGFTDSSNPGSIPLPKAVYSFIQLAIQNSFWASLGYQEAEFFNVAERRDKYPNDFSDDLNTLLAFVHDEKLSAVIGKTWSFSEAKDALISIHKNTHTGKQIIKMDN